MRLLTITFIMTMGISCLAQDMILDDYIWKNRLLLVNTVESDTLFDMQSKALIKHKDESVDRKIKIIKSTNFDLPKSFLKKLEKHNVLLIGLDGGIKSQNQSIFYPADLFALIDGMPMRRQEIETSTNTKGDRSRME